MKRTIEYAELTDRSRDYIHHSVRVFSLGIDLTDEPFGYFFVDNKASTLVWNGTLDFADLNHTALQEIPYQIHGEEVDSSEVLKSATASFILSSNEVVVYELKSFSYQIDYERALESSNQILFARYDVRGGLGLPFDYSFTAENSFSLNSDDGELAIRLPNPQRQTRTLWTPALLEWIIRHHSAASAFAKRVNWKDSSETLEYLTTRMATLQPI
jgi:hypothetical protein